MFIRHTLFLDCIESWPNSPFSFQSSSQSRKNPKTLRRQLRSSVVTMLLQRPALRSTMARMEPSSSRTWAKFPFPVLLRELPTSVLCSIELWRAPAQTRVAYLCHVTFRVCARRGNFSCTDKQVDQDQGGGGSASILRRRAAFVNFYFIIHQAKKMGSYQN